MPTQIEIIDELKRRLNPFIENTANKYGLDSSLVHAVIEAESAYNPVAVSPKGAKGLMQLMPATAKELGVKNPLDPKQNIEGGVKYLSGLVKQYNGNVEKALSAYNAGPGNVNKNFPETQKYVQKVSASAGIQKQETPLDRETIINILRGRGYSDDEIADKLAQKTTGVQYLSKDSPIKRGISKIARPLLEYGGMMVGGIAGSAATPIAGTVAGAALGYGAGAATADILEEQMGIRKQVPIGERLLRTAKDIKTGAELEMGGQVLGKVGGAVIKKVLSPKANIITEKVQLFPPTKEGQAVAKMAAKQGIEPTVTRIKPEIEHYMKLAKKVGYEPTAAELAGYESRALSMIEGALGYMPGSADIMQKNTINRMAYFTGLRDKLIENNQSTKLIETIGNQIKNEAESLVKTTLSKRGNIQKEQVNKLVKAFTDKFGMEQGLFTTGKSVQDLLGKVKNQRFTAAGNLYNQANKILGNQLVTVDQEVINTAKQLLEVEMGKPSAYRDTTLVSKLQSFIPKDPIEMVAKTRPDVAEFLRTLPPNKLAIELERSPELKAMVEGASEIKIPWKSLNSIRSDLLTLQRQANTMQGTSYVGTRGSMSSEGMVYANLSEALGNNMSKFAEKNAPEAGKIFSEAKKLWRGTEELFDRDILGIMKASPEDLFKRLTSGNEVRLIREIKQILGDKGIEPIKNKMAYHLIQTDKNGMVDAMKSLKMMNKYKENLVELFGQEELRGLRGTLLKVNNLNARFIAKNKGNAIQFLQTVARRDVTGIVDMITRPGSDINLKYAKRLFDKETLKDINTGLVQSIIEKSYTGELFSPQKLGKNFKKYDRALQQLLSPEDYNEIVQTYRAMVKNAVAVERMATNPSQTGQVGLSYMIMKRLWDATTEALKLNFGGAIKEVFGAIYMPKIVAKMYLNPTARRYLTIGFNTPWNAPEAEKVYEGIAKAIGVQVSDLKRERQ